MNLQLDALSQIALERQAQMRREAEIERQLRDPDQPRRANRAMPQKLVVALATAALVVFVLARAVGAAGAGSGGGGGGTTFQTASAPAIVRQMRA